MGDYIYGLNPVLSALQGKRRPTKVLISETLKNKEVENLCRELKVPFNFVSKYELDKITHGANNQGVLCYVEPFVYANFADLIKKVDEVDSSLILVLDGVEDPVNFGSLIRSACCFGVDAIIIAKDRQVAVTPTVIKLSTGASEYVDIVQVTNVSQAIIELQKHGYWAVAADGSGDRLYDEIDYTGKTIIVIGSEGRGVSQLVLKRCDFVARIPISGPVTSLNAAVAGAIFLSAASSIRSKK